MSEPTREQRRDDFGRLCRERGVPLTDQRRIVFEAVLDLDDHPTADQVHASLARRSPGVSRATVYRTLEGLARMGVITKACHPGKAVRYDRRTEVHHHLVCMRCDEVIDITEPRFDSLPIPDTKALGFRVDDMRVQLRGLCRRCSQEEDTR